MTKAYDKILEMNKYLVKQLEKEDMSEPINVVKSLSHLQKYSFSHFEEFTADEWRSTFYLFSSYNTYLESEMLRQRINETRNWLNRNGLEGRKVFEERGEESKDDFYRMLYLEDKVKNP